MKNFKKLLAVLLAGLMLLSLVACGGKDDVLKRGVLQAEGMNKIRSSEHNAHRITENKYIPFITFARARNFPFL